jgi:hypothetical protein
MKIYCDFCGSQIETTENKTCPHCGGYYSHDKELLDEKERVKKLNELEMEKQQLDIERMRLENQKNDPFNINNSKLANRGAKGCLAGVIAGLCIFGIFFILMLICVFAEEAGDSSSSKMSAATTAVPRTSISVSYSLDPIEIPKIPEIPEININDYFDR